MSISIERIREILKYCNKAGKYRAILNHVNVVNGTIEASDLDTSVTIKDHFNLIDGCYEISTLGLVKTPKDSADYPILPKLHRATYSIDISIKHLESYFNFISDDETRSQMMGLGVTRYGIAATDGHRLKFNKNYTDDSLEQDYILPKKSLKILVKLCKLYKVTGVTVKFDESYAYINSSNFTLIIRLISRDFPKWLSVTPSKFKIKTVINNWIKFSKIKPLLNKSNMVTIEAIDGVLTLEVNQDNKFIIGTSSDNFKFGINAKYLDQAIDNKETILSFNSELSAIGIDQDKIIMPIKL